MKDIIQPKLLKGFRDSLPSTESIRKHIIAKLEKVFTLSGFLPIDTPAIEYSEILLGKSGGETEKQVYKFMDQGEREVALRFDLTVPFARFLAQHRNEILLPFKRYHIAKVWRGEKPHSGRYREFMQCDFDVVGSDTASADIEIALLMYRSMKTLGIQEFKIHVSHRGIFNALLDVLDLHDQSVDILRLVDKIKKIGEKAVKEELSSITDKKSCAAILEFIVPAPTFAETLAKVKKLVSAENPHVQRMTEISSLLEEIGIANFFYFDTSITRGLDYYTGIVFETFLSGCSEIGSVCSGGRYDNLVSVYSKEEIPGVGASVGLDRLIAALESLGQLPPVPSGADVLITCIDESIIGHSHKIAEILRSENISVEVFPSKKKLASQFTFAEKKNIPLAIIIGEQEKQQDAVNIRDLRKRENHDHLMLNEAIVIIKELLNP
ncbi:MAG: histidine--tRNA ligase [Spirochaetales bacterium]|nr:histidine--tRNA ligase [Spirochaetales bacterium]